MTEDTQWSKEHLEEAKKMKPVEIKTIPTWKYAKIERIALYSFPKGKRWPMTRAGIIGRVGYLKREEK